METQPYFDREAILILGTLILTAITNKKTKQTFITAVIVKHHHIAVWLGVKMYK